jgi:serine/threonine protein kinase
MNLKPDDTLANRYQICERLSKKPGRSTFLARDLDSQDLVIIKILRFDPDFQWDDLKLFEREALTLNNLDHPAIPKYLDYFDLDEPDLRGFALVQTYIEAPSLETIIKSGRKFSEAEAIELADRLLSILSYLHEQIPPVIHRDIKPSNILLANRSGNSIGDVYLVDFGSVQTGTSKQEGTITIVGTYGYMPPEQFGGQTAPASDLYSLGMTLIYLLTGTHPAELPQVNGQVKFAGEIGNQFRRWLEKMTQPHLDRRFDSDRSAQTTLKSPDGNYGNFSNLQPTKCRTKLYRDRDKLEVFLPKDTLRIEYNEPIKTKAEKAASDISSGTVMTAIGGFFMLMSLVPPLFVFLGYLFLIASVAGVIFMVIETFYNYWRNEPIDLYCNKLVIDRDAIYATHLVSRNETIERTLIKRLRSKADLVIYSPGYKFNKYIDDSRQVQKVRNGLVTIEPELQICCDSHKYVLGNGLSQSELYWLGQELSDFLNLELQVICSTPKIPSLVDED